MSSLHDNNISLLDLVRITFGAHSAVLFLPDLAGECSLALASAESAPFARSASIAPGRGLVGWILRHKQSVIVNDMEHHSHLGYYDERDENVITAFMGCHIPGGGALCIDSTRHRTYSREDQMLLLRFAHHIAQQIRAESLADDAAELRHYLDRIEQITELPNRYPHWREYLARYLALLAESGNFDYAAFSTSAEESSTYTVEGENVPILIVDGILPELPLASGGLVSWVFMNESPVQIEGTDGIQAAPLYGSIENVPLFQSVICIPVFLHRMVCGVLCLAGKEPHTIPSSLRAFLRVAVSQLSIRLESLYIRHRLHMLLPKPALHSEKSPDSASTQKPSGTKEDS